MVGYAFEIDKVETSSVLFKPNSLDLTIPNNHIRLKINSLI